MTLLVSWINISEGGAGNSASLHALAVPLHSYIRHVDEHCVLMRLCASVLRYFCSPALRRQCRLVTQRCLSQSLKSPARLQRINSRELLWTAAMEPSAAGPPGATSQGAKAEPTVALDRELFREELCVKALRVPTKQMQQYMALLSRHLLNKPRMKNTQDIAGDPGHKLVLFSEQISEEDMAPLQITRDGQSMTVGQLIEADGLQVDDAKVQVDYSYFPASQVLQRILPPGTEVPSAFETVGHIAHLNLREELLPWKHVIGQVILDKNPRLRVVVNKVGSIENEWRVFQMEVLASAQVPGADNGVSAGGTNSISSVYETEVRQHGARFKLDFSKVYWNSRLEAEHHRLVREVFQKGDTVLDVMAGIGPFAIPAAQKGCMVWANDLNPDSFRWLRTNIALNKVSRRVVPLNLDGREVIRLAAKGQLPLAAAAAEAAAAAAADTSRGGKKGSKPKAGQQQQQQQQQGKAAVAPTEPQRQLQQQQQALHASQQKGQQVQQRSHQSKQQQQQQPTQPCFPERGGLFQHAVMNLPALAVEFLDTFQGTFDPELWAGQQLPLVHVYTFCKDKEEDCDGMRRRVEAALGGALDADPAFRLVRDVAPNKKMYCISFRVPPSIAFAGAAAASRPAGGQQPPQQQVVGALEGSPAADAASKRQKVA